MGHLMRPLAGGEESEALAAPDPRSTDRLATLSLPEGAIDPDAYRLGPGDRIQVAIWGAVEIFHDLLVLPEGHLFVPNVGMVDVRSHTLSEARRLVREKVLEVFDRVRVDVILTGVRSFKVHAVGAVLAPGSYPASAVARASEIIDLAGGVFEDASLRRIRLIEPDGRVRDVDLVGFRLGGRLDGNPFVTGGAVVEVPRRSRSVLLSGSLLNPGIYEALPDERLSEMLAALGGLHPATDSTRVVLSRFHEPTQSTERAFRYRPGGGDAHDPVLLDGDAVLFRERPDWHRREEVFVTGAVMRPGRHPIPIAGERLSAVIERAGGFHPRANLSGAHVIRPRERHTPRAGELPVSDEATSRTRFDEHEAQISTDSVLVACDFAALFLRHDDSHDVVLRGGDVVEVPEDRNEVRVLGYVREPGSYPHVPGAGIGDYVRAAGGYDGNADKGQSRLAPFPGGPFRRVDGGKPVSSGTVIYVPAKERRSFFDKTRDLTGLLVQVASVVVIVDRLAR